MNTRLAIAGISLLVMVSCIGVECAVAQQQPLIDYRLDTGYLPQTPGVTAGAVGGLINPAAWATGDRRELAFWWNDRDLRPDAVDNFGFANSGGLGFACDSRVFSRDGRTYRATDLQLGLAWGDRSEYLGLAYRRSYGDDEILGRENALVAGTIMRPNRWISWGMSGQFSTESRARQGVFDLGIRPFATDRLTLFADFSLGNNDKLEDGIWGGGINLQMLPGLELGVRIQQDAATDDYLMNLCFGVTIAGDGFNVLPAFDTDGNHTANTYLVRHHSPIPDLVPGSKISYQRSPKFVSLDLENRVLTYQKYQWWDKRRVAWLDLVRWLEAVEGDPEIAGVVLNLAGFRARPSLAWELRTRLEQLQAGGKRIIIHTDRLNMLGYYLASVADRLTIDPQGSLTLPGFAMNRTYLKDMLEKLGIGFQEWRFYESKSAVEFLSRMNMSDADRRQRQRMIDVLYEVVREGVCAGRDLAEADFDAAVDDVVMIPPDQAVELGLVDEISRWEKIGKDLVEKKRCRFGRPARGSRIGDYPERHWGRPARIAVVYAVGDCAMDSGIKGRTTGDYLERLARDPSVAAVVLRADSPGGDPLPSDLVAQGLTRIREAGKPVIVSQGDVAASGGYWISMNGQRVLTTPLTLTGSIGVIGGWVYDDGFGEKTGMASDGVQVGKHADLFTNLRLPILGAGLPVRQLDEEELGLVKQYFETLYADFVGQVARGRGLSEERVRELGEGRVWMGGDAIENGLCDEFGSLVDAIELARVEAGLPADREVTVFEYPPRPLFEVPSLGPRIPGLFSFMSPLLEIWSSATGNESAGSTNSETVSDPGENSEDYLLTYLRTMISSGGRPQLLVPPDQLPSAWLDQSK